MRKLINNISLIILIIGSTLISMEINQQQKGLSKIEKFSRCLGNGDNITIEGPKDFIESIEFIKSSSYIKFELFGDTFELSPCNLTLLEPTTKEKQEELLLPYLKSQKDVAKLVTEFCKLNDCYFTDINNSTTKGKKIDFHQKQCSRRNMFDAFCFECNPVKKKIFIEDPALVKLKDYLYLDCLIEDPRESSCLTVYKISYLEKKLKEIEDVQKLLTKGKDLKYAYPIVSIYLSKGIHNRLFLTIFNTDNVKNILKKLNAAKEQIIKTKNKQITHFY